MIIPAVHTIYSYSVIRLVPTEFRWECLSPFEIIPTVSSLEVKESSRLKILYRPQLASVHNVTAVCHYGEDFSISKTMKLIGTSNHQFTVIHVCMHGFY